MLLVPLGAVLSALFAGLGLRRPRLKALYFVAALALALEAGQWWIDTRSISPLDVMAGLAGACVAIVAAALLQRRGIPTRRILTGVGLLVFVGLAVSFTHSLVRQKDGLWLDGWETGYTVAAGDEVGGERKYQGGVAEARICAGEPGAAFCVEPGASAEARRRLARTAERSQRLQVSAQVVSSSDEQRGPARIVTFSDGPYLRNVTLAQRNRDLVFRVRTPRSGPNGVDYSFVLRGAIARGAPTRVEATFERGAVRMSARSERDVRSGVFDPPLHDSLTVLGRGALAVFLQGRSLLPGTLIMFSGLGLALGWARPSARSAPLLAPLLALAYLVVLDAGLNGALSPGLPLFLVAAVAASFGAVLARSEPRCYENRPSAGCTPPGRDQS